jgi:CheY-like chemotaxis protein
MMGGHIRVESVVGEGSTFHFTANFRLNRAAAPDPQSAPHTEGEEVAAASSELHAAKHDPTSSAGDQATPAVQLNILLAEDNPVNQRVAIAGLEKRGHVVTAVNNGKEAIHALKCEHFDLVLMDVQMPEMDGFEATRAIRLSEHETGQHIPIIAMTAHAMKGDREQCLQSGMDDYIAKPVDPKALAQLIFHWVPPERQSERSREVAASDAGRHSTNLDQIPAASQTRRATPAVDVDVFDLAALEARVEDDQELLAEMIELHLNNSPQLLVEIESAVTMHHGGNLVRSGHTLKGVLKNMCAARSAQAAQKVEAIGSSGKWDLADSALADLTSELELLRLALTDVQQGIHA